MKFTIKGSQSITVADWLRSKKGDVEAVAALSGLTVEQVRELPVQAYEEAAEAVTKAFASVEPSDPRHTIEGVEYRLPSDLMKFETGAFIDFTEAKEEDGDAYQIAILSCLFRPVTNKIGNLYEVEKYTGKQVPELLGMTMASYLGAEVFFCTIAESWRDYTLTSLERAARNLKEML